MNKLCSIIIRCFNEADHLDRLLCGIVQQDLEKSGIEIIAVDSGSSDDSPERLKRHGVNVLFVTPEDFSFGRSCNIGCEAARGDFVAFVSAHAYPVHRYWLSELIKPFEDPKVALSYGKQRGNGQTSYSERQIFKTWYPDSWQGDPDPPFCNNANSAIRRSVWEKLRFDESLTGLEDIDFAKRAILSGYTIKYTPDAEITHVHEQPATAVFNRYRREAIACRRIFADQNFSLFDFIKLYTVNVTSDVYHAWHDGEFRRHFGDICVFRLMQFLGVYTGMRQKSDVSDSLKRRLYYPALLKRTVNNSVGSSTQQCAIINYPEQRG
jgi:glycosyltransferase involved in cell wall biosynthesis